MPASGRISPPVLGDGWVLRGDLIDALRSRWERRVVLVVGGAGFGKSTVLAQAMADNRMARRGTDLWLRCEPADSVPSHLVQGLAAAAGAEVGHLRRDPDAALDELFEHLAQRWPLGVAYVLDDLHEVGGEGAELLRRLVRDAPSNVHFVLSSRQPLAGLARLRALDQVLDVGEEDLRFSAEEERELAALRAVDAELLGGVAGWPALADLAARRGDPAIAADELWSRVVQGLSPSARRSLAEVVAVGGGDPGVLGAACSGELEREELLALPLVAAHDDGSVVPHQLWEDALAEVLAPHEVRATRRRVAWHLLDRGDHEPAVPLFAEAEDWEGFRAAISEACARGYAGPAGDVLADWLARLPGPMRDEPEGLLLEGVVARAHEPFGAETRDLLERSMLGFREAGHVPGEVAAMSEYVYVVRARGEMELVPPVLMRLLELDAAGHRAVEGPVRLARALLAEAAGSDEAFLAELESIPPGSLSQEWLAVAEYLRAQALLHLGRPGEAVEAADRSVAHGGPSYLGGYYASVLMRWYDSRPERALDELPVAGSHPGATPIDLIYTGMYTAAVDAYAGRVDRSRASLEVAERALDEHARPEIRGELAAASAALAVAEGDEERARTILCDLLAELPLELSPTRHSLGRFLPLVEVLVPEARAAIDGMELGPMHLEMRQHARAVLAARAGEEPAEEWARDVAPDEVLVRLPLRWSVEVVCALARANRAEARHLAAGLAARCGDAFHSLVRDAAVGGDAGARRLLRTVRFGKGAPVELRVLGPTELLVDGVAAEGDRWRRAMVRSLLLRLAHGPVGRDEVLALLWPELDAKAALANLRVTLTHLHRVLEPDRPAGEAPFFVRQDRGSIELIGEPHVLIDARRFDALVDRADEARRSGSTEALDAYERAVALWRGEPYEGLQAGGWVGAERDRLRSRFVHAALRAGEIHLAGGDCPATVARAADALGVEPWSEAAYRLLVAGHLAEGDKGSARRALERCRQMLTDLGVPPGAETRMLERIVLDGAQRTSDARRALAG